MDPTPGDSAEFGITVGEARLVAGAASDAFGRIDLLTVLVHEIGHVLGFDHDAGLAIMAASLVAGQRVQLTTVSQILAGPGQVDGALIENPTGTLAAEAGDTNAITFRIFDVDLNGIPDVEVTGALVGGNTTYNDIGTLIGGANLDDTILVDINAYSIWDLTGLNAGTLTIAGYAPISFSSVENLTGHDGANDTFIFDDLGIVTGDIDDRDGYLGLDIGSGALVAVVADGGSVTWNSTTANVVTGNLALGVGGTLTGANLRTLSLTGTSLFAGRGASVNGTGDGIVTAGAVGFSVTGASLSFANVVSGADSFTGVQAGVTNAVLVGVGGVDLQVSGSVKRNLTNRGDEERIDWTTATDVANDPGGLDPSPGDYECPAAERYRRGVLRHRGGQRGGDRRQPDVRDGLRRRGHWERCIGPLTGADVISISATGANLFVGTGAALNVTRDAIVTTSAKGFLVSGASFAMATVTSGADRFIGTEATVLDAALLGVSGVHLQVSGSVKSNVSNRVDGERMDWATRPFPPTIRTT